MNSRLKTSKKDQVAFFASVKSISGKGWKELADMCDISDRTLRDWSRAKYFAPYKQYVLLNKKFSVPLPEKFKLIDRFWYVSKGAKLGGLRRYQLHGAFGDQESRKKGGIASQQNRRIDPDKYRSLGCIVRKNFVYPELSDDLAELVGIFLGDGCIGDYQVKVTLNREDDRNYAFFVSSLIKKVLKEKPTWSERDNNTINLTLSGVNLIEILEDLGLRRGNKIKNKIKFPEWILNDNNFRRSCIRGLFDTDGGLYFHRHSKWKDKKPYLGWCFTSHSPPLLNDYYESLKILDLSAKKVADKHLYMYSVNNIVKYFKVVGSNNLKNFERFKYYISIRSSAKRISEEHGLKLRRGAPNW